MSAIFHIGAVRTRVVGYGELDYQFLGYNDIETETLVPVTMAQTRSREQTVLSNFVSQVSYLKGSTDLINEQFRINRIVVFVKPLWADYPHE